MRWLIDFAVRRPIAVTMGYCAMALLAYAAWINLPVDVVPSPDDFPQINVETAWQGASPESVQALVTSPIEAIAVSIPGVRGVRSVSQRGNSSVQIEFTEDANVELARFELSDRLSILREDLPPSVMPPTLRQTLPREFQNLQQTVFFRFTLRGPRDLNELRRIAKEDVEEALASVEGVAEVDVAGGQDPHLRITLDPEKLDLYGIRSTQVRNAVQELDASWPVGQVELSGTAYSLRVDHVLEDLAPLRTLPVGRVENQIVTLADLGEVAFGYADATQYTRVNGEPLVQVTLVRKPGTDVLTVARLTRERLARLETELPSDLTFEVLSDEAEDLEAELALLQRRLMFVLVLVGVLLIVLLRDLRSAPLLFTSIGAALAITIIALYHLKVPVNVLTLTGLALAFGMLVDNAVVVLENIMRYREGGSSAAAAARRGTREVVVPVLAATLTTIGVFFPFVYFQGRMRSYFTPLAISIALALTASLWVSLTLMPAVAGRGWLAKRVRQRELRLPRFRTALGYGLRFRWVVLLLVAGGWYWAYALFDEHVPRGDFFRFWGGRDQITVYVTLQSGAEASRTEAAIRPFEEYVLGLPNIERVEVDVRDNQGTLQVKFPLEYEQTAYPLLVKDEMIGIATRYAGLRVSVYGFDQNGYSSGFGGSSFFSSRIKLYGYNYEQLGVIGEDIARMAKRSLRVQEANVTAGGRGYWRDQGAEIILRVRRDRLAAQGMTVDELRFQLQGLLAGRTVNSKLRVGLDEWDMELKVAGVDRRSLQEALGTPIGSGAGSVTRLGDLVEVAMQSVPGEITREDQRYDRYVQWEYRGSSRASNSYREAIFESLELPPGYSASLEATERLTEEERLQIRQVATLALIIVFMVLASLYESLLQPFVVLLSVPGSLIGVFMIFYLTGRSFDASASIGVVLLGGIVVNNAILLVDHINLRRGELPLLDAIVTGTAERVRPILITSITTVGGMLPLVLIEASEEAARNSDIWRSLALSTIGGLSASTILTLTVTPILYLLAERWRRRGDALVQRVVRIWKALPA